MLTRATFFLYSNSNNDQGHFLAFIRKQIFPPMVTRATFLHAFEHGRPQLVRSSRLDCTGGGPHLPGFGGRESQDLFLAGYEVRI